MQYFDSTKVCCSCIAKLTLFELFLSQRHKTYLRRCEPREDSDSHRLIKIFTGRSLDSHGCTVTLNRQRRLRSDFVVRACQKIHFPTFWLFFVIHFLWICGCSVFSTYCVCVCACVCVCVCTRDGRVRVGVLLVVRNTQIATA